MNGTVVRWGISNGFHSRQLMTVKNIMNYPRNLKFPEKGVWMCLHISKRVLQNTGYDEDYKQGLIQKVQSI